MVAILILIGVTENPLLHRESIYSGFQEYASRRRRVILQLILVNTIHIKRQIQAVFEYQWVIREPLSSAGGSWSVRWKILEPFQVFLKQADPFGIYPPLRIYSKPNYYNIPEAH